MIATAARPLAHWSVILIAALVFGTACDRAENRIVGKWRVAGEENAIWEFSANKTVNMSGRTGKYSFGDQGRLKVQTQFATFVYQLDVSDDRMVLAEPGGRRLELTRMK